MCILQKKKRDNAIAVPTWTKDTLTFFLPEIRMLSPHAFSPELVFCLKQDSLCVITEIKNENFS